MYACISSLSRQSFAQKCPVLSFRPWHLFLLYQHLYWRAFIFVLSQLIPWPERISANVTWERNSFQMLCFDVISNCHPGPLLSTHFADLGFWTSCTAWCKIFTFLHKWFHNFVKFFRICWALCWLQQTFFINLFCLIRVLLKVWCVCDADICIVYLYSVFSGKTRLELSCLTFDLLGRITFTSSCPGSCFTDSALLLDPVFLLWIISSSSSSSYFKPFTLSSSAATKKASRFSCWTKTLPKYIKSTIEFRSSDFIPFMKMNGKGCLCLLRRSWKNKLEAEITTLWASTWWPSS